MARLINLREAGRLHLWVNHRSKEAEPRRPPVALAGLFGKAFAKPDGDWPEAVLSATSGLHANRPWAQLLNSITRQSQARSRTPPRIPPTKR